MKSSATIISVFGTQIKKLKNNQAYRLSDGIIYKMNTHRKFYRKPRKTVYKKPILFNNSLTNNYRYV